MKEKSSKELAYELPKQEWWEGRDDGGETNQLRWWQHIKALPLTGDLSVLKNGLVLLGFACDEGVYRNKGRVGSASGPFHLRKALANLPIHNSGISLLDLGNIHCINRDLVEAQEQLGQAVKEVIASGGFPIILGGGHEVLYGHYTGVVEQYKGKRVSVLNFDAHFDIRKPGNNGVSSGTGFYQIAEDCKEKGTDFLYLALGIQRSGNTAELFERVNNLNTEYVLAQDFHSLNLEKIKEKIKAFMDGTDFLCITMDLDVFSSSLAPGVSAPAAAGIFYDHAFREIWKLLAASKKVISLDIAEFNPLYDVDSKTAKLAAQLIFDWVDGR